jgi:uncharacterized protein YkwD
MKLIFPNMFTLIEMHNKARGDNWWKLKPLEPDNKLMMYAQDWALYMSQKERMYHSKIKNIMNLGFNSAGENIAYGQKNETTVMKTWLNSAGHRANIMSSTFTHIGCGFGYSDDDILFWCVCFGKKK